MAFTKRKVTAFIAGAVSLAVIAGSWAFFHSESTIDNNLSTAGYGSRTVEDFTPDQKIEPGSKITKEVGVVNTGDYDLVVRIKMQESWKRGGAEFIGFKSSDAGFNTVAKAGTAYTATQVSDTDGLVTGDQTVMYKEMDTTVNWINGGDGYWYYKAVLPASANTGALLKSLTLANNTDMGRYTQAEMYSTVSATNPALVAAQTRYDAALATYKAAPNATNKAALDAALKALDAIYAWTTVKPTDTSTITFIKAENKKDDTAGGYSSADYTLSIITETCQATEEAVNATWTTNPLPAAVKTAWGW